MRAHRARSPQACSQNLYWFSFFEGGARLLLRADRRIGYEPNRPERHLFGQNAPPLRPSPMTRPPENPRTHTRVSLLREPLVHFFVLGLGLFLAQHLVHQEPREIIVTEDIKADLSRRFEDVQGHVPSADEMAQEVKKWARDEALFREAMRRGLEQDDASVRSVLVDKMQALAAARVRDAVPTDADLETWLAAHRDRYVLPVRYDFEFLTVGQGEQARDHVERLKQALAAGQPPQQLGQPLRGAHLDASALKGRVAKELAAAVPRLSVGTWHEVEGASEIWLVRVKRTTGGMPEKSQIRAQLTADWVAAWRQQQVDAILQKTVDLYQVEERQ